MSSSSSTTTGNGTTTTSMWQQSGTTYWRPLGPSEIAFIPASADGTGDMFLHLSLSAPASFLQLDRVALAWAILRARHPTLASKVVVSKEGELEASFVYSAPANASEAVEEAKASLTFNGASKQELFDAHMDGPRVLTESHLSHLTIATPAVSSSGTGPRPYDLFIAAPHFTGDGTTLHASTHELLLLLGRPDDLQEELERALPLAPSALPLSLEAQLPQPKTRFQRAVHAVSLQLGQAREIGAPTLPRESRGQKKTVLWEMSLDEEKTAWVLKKCKAEGVSVSNAIFALVAMAWARTLQGKVDVELPTLIYSALSLRTYLPPSPTSYWFTALGYFNIIVPSFLPKPDDLVGCFWHRARSARAQTIASTSSPLLVPKSLVMSAGRQARAKGNPLPYSEIIPSRAPSKALCGISLIGNLDRTYTHNEYAPGVELHTVTTASRLRPAGFLLLAHTFRARLWFHLVWDQNGFEAGAVERFWEVLPEMLGSVCAGDLVA